jgi:quinol monooxygenase YgiN
VDSRGVTFPVAASSSCSTAGSNGCESDEPEEDAMDKIASLITLKARPGQRDAVRKVWEKYARGYIGASAFDFYYCYDDADPDAIIVFGMADAASNQAFAQQPWFADYQRETQALLVEPGEIRRATPQFAKASA